MLQLSRAVFREANEPLTAALKARRLARIASLSPPVRFTSLHLVSPSVAQKELKSMSDVFAGGAAKIKDHSGDSAPQPARRSFEVKNLPPASTPPTGADEEESQVVFSKFTVRGGAGAGLSSRNTPSKAAGAAAEGAASGDLQQPLASIFSRGSNSSTKQPRQASPPPPTPISSGEQMPPPPLASQRRRASTHLDTPRRSTSHSSTEASRTVRSNSDGGRRTDGARGSRSSAEQLRGGARSREQHHDKAAGVSPDVGGKRDGEPQLRKDRSTHEQRAETGSKSPSEEEDQEETPMYITEDRPTPSPMVVGDAEEDEELVMSGGGGTGYGGGGEASSEEESSSEEEEDEVVLAGQEGSQVGIKRERDFEDSEDEAEYKGRDRRRRSPVSSSLLFSPRCRF